MFISQYFFVNLHELTSNLFTAVFEFSPMAEATNFYDIPGKFPKMPDRQVAVQKALITFAQSKISRPTL